MRRIIEDETKTAVFRVDVTEENVSVVVTASNRPQQRFDIAPADAEHLMGLLSEALYGMRRSR